MKALSPSKINLTLEILGIKENQYHEISSIMQTLDLSDEMSFNLSSSERTVHFADAVILCTGGHTRIWKKSSSRKNENTGDGY